MLNNPRSPAIHRPPRRPALAALVVLVGTALAIITVACKSDNERAPADARRTTTAAPAGESTAAPAISHASGDPYLVTFSVSDSSTPIGAIQFEVRPKSDKGGFATNSGKVECDSLIGEALSAFSTHADGKLVAALVDVGGFEAPAAVARCTYLSPQAPSPDAFILSVTDASDVQAVALRKLVVVEHGPAVAEFAVEGLVAALLHCAGVERDDLLHRVCSQAGLAEVRGQHARIGPFP